MIRWMRRLLDWRYRRMLDRELEKIRTMHDT
jgi:hypothetical protein